MSSEEEIFEAAAALPEPERGSYLDKACTGSPELRSRLEVLLRSHDVSGFMEDRTVAAKSPPHQTGERIGRYRLVQQIGEGGFGVVWMAEQIEPVTRRVALKIIKAGMDTNEVIARFEAERQALAMMDHPHIARVFDAGATDKGRPFFVMELVSGIPLTKFCDEQQFTTRQRLELFTGICSAINHAHQKGVIHRDIKPSNVMVTLDGDRPVVKVIDFGIAKATQGRLTDRTVYTRFEQFLGTPAYMSPEQAATNEMDIDTRSDIYSLGVLLYELLTGKPPFDAKSLLSAGYEEMRRIIREVEPLKPSTQLNNAGAHERTALAKGRQIPPEKLSRAVEPDLDWIVMKAIDKDRDRRYPSASDLALDLQRYLDDEPVSAGPPTASYRLRKFVHRNRLALRIAGVLAIVLIAATVVSASMAIRALKAEERANQKATEEAIARSLAEDSSVDAENLITFVAGILRRADSGNGGRGMPVREAVNLAIDELSKESPETMEQNYNRRESFLWSLRRLGFTHETIPLQRRLRDFFVAKYGLMHSNSIITSTNLAMSLREDPKTEGGLQMAVEILEELVSHENVWPAGESYKWIYTLETLGGCYMDSNRMDEAIRAREKALQYCRKNYADGPNDPKTLKRMHMLANAYFIAGRDEDALKLREETAQLYRKVCGVKEHNTLVAIHNFAESLFETGRKNEATRLMEEILPVEPEVNGAKHRDTLEAMHDLATCYFDAGRYEEALRLRQEVLPLRKEILEREHPHIVDSMNNLAVSLTCAGRLSESVPLQEEALVIARRKLPPNHPVRVAALTHMAILCEMTGRIAESEGLRKELGPGSVPAVPLPISIEPRLPR